MTFQSLALRPRLLDAVSEMGYTSPTPIQREAIPHVLDGRDVVGCAQTGTGKTAAFVLPTLQLIKPGSGLKALVVTPTRELAQQIGDVAREVSRFSRHRVAEIYGGVGYEPQLKKLRRGVDMVIATPGRLLDIHARGEIDLSEVEVLVLDEADRMLDMGFWPDVRRILHLLPERRQNLLFSATMSSSVLSVVRQTLTDPIHIETSPATTTVDGVKQMVYPVSAQQKSELLVALLEKDHLDRVLVFTRTKHRADRVHRQLSRQGISSASIHGGRSQAQRQQALDSFKAGRTRVLVATDVVARGIDVDEISHVINYDMPNSPEDYVHRIGRTARAGSEGSAISFLAAEETTTLHDIERKLGLRIDCIDHEGFKYASDRIIPVAGRDISTRPRAMFAGGVMRGRARTGRGRSGRGSMGARR